MVKNVVRIIQNQLWKFWVKRVDLVFLKTPINGADCRPSGLNTRTQVMNTTKSSQRVSRASTDLAKSCLASNGNKYTKISQLLLSVLYTYSELQIRLKADSLCSCHNKTNYKTQPNKYDPTNFLLFQASWPTTWASCLPWRTPQPITLSPSGLEPK